eukprot:GHVU01195702.1.p1 GENE.GHVU01195702.1~~GHVU01195702.1.p1  ORF type:complete len:790 (+),score=71.85 GHVU01195702.1:355-2724(+)
MEQAVIELSWAEALPYLDFPQHYQLSRCARFCAEVVRRHYTTWRGLNSNLGKAIQRRGNVVTAAQLQHLLGYNGVRHLERMKLSGVYKGCRVFTSMIGWCAERLRELSVEIEAPIYYYQDGMDEYGRPRGEEGPDTLAIEFPRLETLRVKGRDAVSYWFRLIAGSAWNLRDLHLVDVEYDILPDDVPQVLGSLSRLHLEGTGSSRWFATVAATCAATLESLTVRDSTFTSEYDILPDDVPQVLGSLSRLHLEGTGSSRWFATVAATCAATLESLTVRDSTFTSFADRLRDGDFKVLESLAIAGMGASACLQSLCSGSQLSITELIVEEEKFPPSLPSEFNALRKLNLIGAGATACFDAALRSCAHCLEELEILEIRNAGLRMPVDAAGSRQIERSDLSPPQKVFACLRTMKLSGSATRTILESRFLTLKHLAVAHVHSSGLPRIPGSESEGLVVELDLRGLQHAVLSGTDALAILRSCASSLRTFNVSASLPPDCELPALSFPALVRCDMRGRGMSRFLASISAPCVRAIAVRDPKRFVSPPRGRFVSLKKLVCEGPRAMPWFAGLAGSCAATLVELKVKDVWQFASPITGMFSSLRVVDMSGVDVSKSFVSIAASCCESLRELRIDEVGCFPSHIPGAFKKLERVQLSAAHGGASIGFASISESCSATLKVLRINDHKTRAATSLPGSFSFLVELELEGKGASVCFSSISESCTRLRNASISDSGSFVQHLPGTFDGLSRLKLRGEGAMDCSFSAPESCEVDIASLGSKWPSENLCSLGFVYEPRILF